MSPWTIDRSEIERDPYAKKFPAWARHLAILGYREQGWSASDQRNGGELVATGDWGDKLWLRADGIVACTQYPEGYPIARKIEGGLGNGC